MRELKAGQMYMHFKGIKVEVVGVAKHSETLENLVIYKHLGTDELWARPEAMFLDETDITNKAGNVTGQKYRFELISE